MDYDMTVKTILIGDSSVGKSSLLYRYTDNDWNPYYIATIGVDFKVTTLERQNKVIKLQLWDTAGQERFRSITQSYYKGANAIALVFDVNDRDTFEGLKIWINDVNNFGTVNVPVVMIGNKCDLATAATKSGVARPRAVPTEEASAFASNYGFQYFETSAKTGQGVQEAFECLVDKCVSQREKLTVDARTRRGVILPAHLGEKHNKEKNQKGNSLCGCN